MRGVILAGGLGTRLYPLTYATSKILLPVYNKPMIYYPIQNLVRAGVKEVLIVVGAHAGHFVTTLRSKKALGLKHLEYAYQEKSLGMVDALKYAEDFARGHEVFLLAGDNITDFSFRDAVKNFKGGATIFTKKVSDPSRYGVPRFNSKTNEIEEIIEKPTNPPSEFAVTGFYLYDKHWREHAEQVKPGSGGQYEITDLNNAYLKQGKLSAVELKGFWSDAGTFDSLFEANQYWYQKLNPQS